MRSKVTFYLGLFIFILSSNLLSAQEIDFTIRYNFEANQYEIYGKSNTTIPNYFVGGGSQLSIVFPASVADVPLAINTVNGGAWTDNSQIFAPSVMSNHDFHSIASNGSQLDWIFGQEVLLFTFTIPEATCVPGIRLFNNANDPSSAEPSMNGSDFKNYFANVFTFEDNYRSNYDNIGISCGNPMLPPPDTIYIPQDSLITTCIPFTDADVNDTHTFLICEQPSNGTATGTINNNSNEVCLTLIPNTAFSGNDEVCLMVCDQTGLCDTVVIPIKVTPAPIIVPPGNPPSVIGDSLVIPQNTTGIVCLPITDADVNDTHTFLICEQPNNGIATGTINNNSNEVCLTLTPNTNFSGNDEVCLMVCDQTGLCDTVVIPIKVTPAPIIVPPTGNPPSVMDDSLFLPENIAGIICLPITDTDINDVFTTTVCGVENGTVYVNDNEPNLTCINYRPNTDFIGFDEVCLIVCDQTGLCDTAYVKIVVGNMCPTSKPFIRHTSKVCEDGIIEFETNPINVPAITYTWTNGLGAILSSNPSFSLNANDAQVVSPFRLSIQAGDCPTIHSDSVFVELINQPIISNLRADASVCFGETLQLSAENAATDGQLIQYTWTGPNGFEETGQTTSGEFQLVLDNLNPSQVGTYTLILAAENACEEVRQSIMVEIGNDVEAPSLKAVENVVCSGKDVELTATIQDDNEVEFEWFLQNANGDLSFMMTTQHPSLVLENATSDNSGNYLVRTKKGDCVSGFSNTEIITVFDISTTILPTNNTSVNQQACLNSFVQLEAPFYENATYEWTGPNGFTANTANPGIDNITEDRAGEYFVVVTIAGCDPVTSLPTEVFVQSVQTAPVLNPIGTICEGGNLVLQITNPITPELNDQIQYEWYFSGTSNSLGNTTNPSLEIGEASDKYNGTYHVIRTWNGCSLASDTVSIQITPKLPLTAMTIADYELCQAREIDLIATVPSEGVGKWSTTTGALIINPNEAVTTATDLQIGLNEFIWTVSDECGQSISDTLNAKVQGLTSDVAFAGIDQQLCNATTAQLNATQLSSANGLWTQSLAQASQGIKIESPNNFNTEINGLEPGNAYTFTWTISEGSCADFDSDDITIISDELPAETPLIITQSFTLCEQERINLEATIPLFSTGQWTTSSEAIITNPLSSTTTVSNLQQGKNQFIWSLSNASCVNYAADTLDIFLKEGLIANADNYMVNFNDSLSFDVLANDSIYNKLDVNFIITKYPDFGRLTEETDGTIKYVPRRNFFGEDNFRYKLCNRSCEEICDTTIVNLLVTNASGSGNCFIPNGLTPNNDNVNDQLIIPCLFGNTENELMIFNRWGDEVYRAAPYLNDWAGTHKGQPLPAGTYFYILRVDANNQETIQGYLTIFR